MVPVLVATIGSVAWVGPLANLIAVPIVSVVVVPLDLVAGVTHRDRCRWRRLGRPPRRCDRRVRRCVSARAGAASTGRVGARRAAHRRWSSSSIACGLMLLPLSWRHRALLLPCIVLPLAPIESRPLQRQFAMTVLDVGQGLSVIVETARHRLLYDAGPRFPSGFDLGAAVVVPNLRRDARTPSRYRRAESCRPRSRRWLRRGRKRDASCAR